MESLEGKVAFITGGARGQGRSHARLLATHGANIVLFDACQSWDLVSYPMASEEQLHETKDMVEQAGVSCLALRGDVRSLSDVEGAIGKAVAQFGQVDFLLANAGVAALKPLVECSAEEWAINVDVNLTGVFNAIRAVLPSMVERRSGKIVATSSVGGRAGGGNAASYVASKWGVLGLMKSAAIEAGPYGITVNAVCPTNVNTDMWRNDMINKLFRPDLEQPTFEDIEPIATQVHPLGVPHIEAEDVSNAILFLLSDAARYISGEVLHVSAGLMARNTA
jgi:SDR family mycofactocin-dependent oxidoreductase